MKNPNTPSTVIQQKNILDELSTLQQSARLGMHVWESHTAGALPTTTLSVLKGPNAEIEAAREAGDAELLSISLVPAKGRKRGALTPYCLEDNVVTNAGYLLDLRQDINDRAILPRISEFNIGTGGDSKNKEMYYNDTSQVPEVTAALDELRDRLPNPENPMSLAFVRQFRAEAMKIALAPEGVEKTAGQLDGVNRYMQQMIAKGQQMLPLNEILASLKMRHVKAIVVNAKPSYAASMRSILDEDVVRLHGAVLGMRHLDAGIDLPVVMYHVNGLEQGKLTMIGQGYAALREVALEALSRLNERAYDMRRMPQGIASAVHELLDIDVKEPVGPQLLLAREASSEKGRTI